MPARKPKPVTLRRPPPDIEGPSKPGPGQSFVIETFAEKSVGTSRRYRNLGESPLTQAWHSGQLSDDQYRTGNTFRTLFLTAKSSGKDSTLALDAGRCSGHNSSHMDLMLDADRALARIEANMGARNYRIVNNFCGKGMEMAESIQRVTACHPNGVKYRFLEALEDLDDALDKARIKRVWDLPRDPA